MTVQILDKTILFSYMGRTFAERKACIEPKFYSNLVGCALEAATREQYMKSVDKIEEIFCDPYTMVFGGMTKKVVRDALDEVWEKQQREDKLNDYIDKL